jgi:DNA-binding helix-hairpin-helix protein with protein kinase domain
VQYYCPQKNCSAALSPAQKIGGGGEGSIYVVTGMPNLVAKVFHRPTLEQQRKLELMLALPCNPQPSGTPPVAWPEGLLFRNAKRERFSGYLMPRVTGACPANELYNPKSRRAKCPGFNYRYLHRAALNIALCCRLAHERGFVIGDLNESTFLVRDNCCVTMVDAESMQMTDPASRRTLRCRVGKSDFTPAELQGKNLATAIRTLDHDHFALGVLLFKLLMEGVHPFDAVFQGSGTEVPPIEYRIAAGQFPHGTRFVPWTPKPLAPPFKLVPPKLEQLFIRCFETGHFNPKARPDAKTWIEALRQAEEDLVQCQSNRRHWHGSHLSRCPWCDRASVLGLDPFPDKTAVLAGLRSLPITSRLTVRNPRASVTQCIQKAAVAAPHTTKKVQKFIPQSKTISRFHATQWLIAIAVIWAFVLMLVLLCGAISQRLGDSQGL